MTIRGIGFDYLGVTARMPEGDFWGDAARIFGVTPAELSVAYRVHRPKLQVGEVTSDELWELIARDLGKPGKDRIVKERDSAVPLVDPNICALADRLRARGYKVGILSNLSGSWAESLYAQGTDQHFDAVVLSCDTHFAKPDPRAFQFLAERLDVPTDELVFIDDRQEAIEGVEDLGIAPILYKNYEQLLSELSRLGIDVGIA